MKRKIKALLVKYEKVTVLLFIIISVMTFSFNIKLDVSDELWNFSNMYKMKNGYTIYKDLNVIITPFIFYIGKIIFEIFGSNYLVSRITNVIIFSIFYFLIYEIYRTLGIKKQKSILYLILIYSITYYIIMTGMNYNILALDFCFMGILLILKQKANWLQGIIIFSIFMTKQNIGVYYAIGYTIFQLTQSANIKEALKRILQVGGMSIGLVGIYLVYLWINQNLYHFINYAFLGIGEFGSKNLGYNEAIYTLIFIILLYPIILWMLKSKKLKIDKKIRKQAYMLISFGGPLLLTAYPLINQYHVDFAIILSIITLIYIFEKSFLEELTEHKIIENIIKIIIMIFITGIILLCCYENIPYCIEIKNNHYPMYYGAIIDEKMKKNIDTVIKYMEGMEKEGKNTIILSYYANLYMNITGRNNGKMDLPFYGNLGKEGEDGLIQEIDKLKNTNLLILKEEDTVFQESKKVREHIINTYERIGEIEQFLIYKVGY